MRGRIAGAGAVVLAATAIVGCSSGSAGQGSSSSGGRSSATTSSLGDSDLAEALRYTPRTATEVTFGASGRSLKRHGIAATSDPSAVASANAAALDNQVWLAGPLAKTWGWSGMDTMWTARIHTGDELINVLKFRDGFDMSKVAKSLTNAGYAASTSGTTTTYTTSPDKMMDSAGVPGLPYYVGTAITLDVTERVLRGAMGRDTAPAPIDARASLASEPAVITLVHGLPAVDWADLTTGSAACMPLGSTSMTAAQRSQLDHQTGVSAMKPVTGSVAAMVDEKAALVRTSYASATDAAADLPRRQKAFTGTSPASGQPFSAILPLKVSREDDVLVYRGTLNNSSVLPQAVSRRDTPWAWCPQK